MVMLKIFYAEVDASFYRPINYLPTSVMFNMLRKNCQQHQVVFNGPAKPHPTICFDDFT